MILKLKVACLLIKFIFTYITNKDLEVIRIIASNRFSRITSRTKKSKIAFQEKLSSQAQIYFSQN